LNFGFSKGLLNFNINFFNNKSTLVKNILIKKNWWEKNWNDDNLWYASTFENIHNLKIAVLESFKNSKYNFRMFNFEGSFANVNGS